MRHVRVVMLAVVLLSGVACGESADQIPGDEAERATRIRYYIGTAPIPGVSPWFVGKEKGFFADAGLEVEFVPGESAAALPGLIEGGKADMGSADFLSLALLKSENPDVSIRIVAVHHARSPVTIYSLKEEANLEQPADLEGVTLYHRVGGLSGGVVEAWARKKGIDVVIKDANPDVVDRLLIQGEAPGTLSLTLTRPPLRALAEKAGKELVSMELADYGLDNFYGTGISVGDTFMEENPEAVRAFVEASLKAFEYSFDHPEEAGRIMEEQFPTIPAESVPPALEEIETVVTDEGRLDRIGAIDPDKVESTVAWIEEAYGIEIDAESLYTTEFLD